MSQRYACPLPVLMRHRSIALRRPVAAYRYRTNVHNRSQLLGTSDYSTPPSSGRSSPFGAAVVGRENPYAPLGQRYADDLESQNDEHLEGLTAKVKILKDVRNLFKVHIVSFLTVQRRRVDHVGHWV